MFAVEFPALWLPQPVHFLCLGCGRMSARQLDDLPGGTGPTLIESLIQTGRSSGSLFPEPLPVYFDELHGLGRRADLNLDVLHRASLPLNRNVLDEGHAGEVTDIVIGQSLTDLKAAVVNVQNVARTRAVFVGPEHLLVEFVVGVIGV